jgi:hypothetical protein
LIVPSTGEIELSLLSNMFGKGSDDTQGLLAGKLLNLILNLIQQHASLCFYQLFCYSVALK